MMAGDSIPTGVLRTLAAMPAVGSTPATVGDPAGIAVAVIDTGIDLTHPDLNASAGKNCMPGGGTPQDTIGHGSHVSGTIAGRNQGAGVVGVAPGTKVVAVKVLDNTGGTFATLICGIDWVTQNNIKVANMSLGGSVPSVGACGSDPLHLAICNSTAAGTTYIVSAGNDGRAFDAGPLLTVPAAYPEVLTVTAGSDSNGKLGAGAAGLPPACPVSPPQVDEMPATFSNFAKTAAGERHTISAPGVCIRSAWKLGGYNTISGTSMAAPHMTAEVALCIRKLVAGACNGMTPAQIIQKMRSDATAYNTANPAYGFVRDPLHTPLAGKYYGFYYRSLPPGPNPSSSCPANLWAKELRAASPAIGTAVPGTSITNSNAAGDRIRMELNFRPSPTISCREARIVVAYDGPPTGWTVNVGDSSTNNGYGGGDSSTTAACAEIWVVNTSVSAFKHCPPTDYGPLALLPTPPPLSLRDGALQFVVRNQYLSVGQPFASPAAGDLSKTFHIPDTGFLNAVPADAYKIYLGLNRVVHEPPGVRVGSGVRWVMITMR